MKFWRNKKIILGILIGIVVFSFVQFAAMAANADKAPAEGGPVEPVLQITGILATFSNLVARILTLIAGLVDFATKLGNNVLDLAAVKIGWQVVLGFTNLGFVLAIIIIAFATIFRMQSYAMKQVLWKLIVAALLVNFSLVIAGAFISVSNTVSDTMIKAAIGEKGSNLSNALAGAVNPQKFAKVGDPGAGDKEAGFFMKKLGELFNFIAGLVFIIIFSLLIIFVFAALFVMLLARAIILVFLLVLSPVVWLLWIFPATASHWQKWWSEFIRWNFFTPVVFFFIYLAIATAGCMNPNGNCPIKNSKGTFQGETLSSITEAQKERDSAARVFEETNIAAGVTGAGVKGGEVGKAEEGFFAHIANLFVVLSLLFGSLIVANKFGIAGGAMGVKLAQGAGKWMGGAVGKAGGWAGRKTYEKTAGRVMGSEKVKGWTEKLAGSKFIGARLLGTGLNRLGMKSETLMQNQYKDLAKGMTPERLNNEILASRGAKRAALIKEAAGRKDINMEKLAPILNNPEEMGKILGDLKKTGLNFKDVEKAVGRSFEMMTAKTDEELMSATDKFVQSLTPKDFAKGQWNDTFKETSDPRLKNMQNQLAGSFAQYSPGAFAKIAPHIKTENLENFAGIAEMQAMLLTKYQHADKEIEQKMRKQGDLALKALNKTLDRRAMFGEEAWTPTSPKEEV